MPKYRFSEIAINVTDKRMPVPEDKDLYIAPNNLDTDTLSVPEFGYKVDLNGTKLIMHKGDMLFGRREPQLKKAAIAPHDGLFSAHGMIFHPREEVVTKEFFPFFISSDYFFDAAIRISVGSLSPTVNWKDLKDLEFNIPDLTAQQEYAKVLWAMIRAKKAYKELIKKTDDLVKSQFIEMFGDPSQNPFDHPMKKLSELGELNRGVSKARPRNKPELLGGPYPLVQTGEVSSAGLYINHYENTYSEEGLAQSRMWPKGTLCITIAANIAQTGILAFDACFPDSVCGFISNGSVTQIYMHYWFSFFQKVLEEQAPQVAQRNINLRILSDLDVMTPPMPLQQRFNALVEQSDKSKFAAQQALKEVTDAQKALMKKIFE